MSIKVSGSVGDGPGAINDNALYIIALSVAGECLSESHSHTHTVTNMIIHRARHMAMSCEQSLPFMMEKTLWALEATQESEKQPHSWLMAGSNPTTRIF